MPWMGGWVPRSVGGHARARGGWGVPAAPSVCWQEKGRLQPKAHVHVSDVRAAAGGLAAPVSRAPPSGHPAAARSQVDATPRELAEGKNASDEFIERTKTILLRLTNEVISSKVGPPHLAPTGRIKGHRGRGGAQNTCV